MAQCDVCGNDHDNSFQIIEQHVSPPFDSFECAITALAPRCPHCGCRIIGHGVESGAGIYCCAHCAKDSGHQDLQTI